MKLRIFILTLSLVTLAGTLVQLGIRMQHNDEKRAEAERESLRLQTEAAASVAVESAWNALLRNADSLSPEAFSELSKTIEMPALLRPIAENAFSVQNMQYHQYWNARPASAELFEAQARADIAAAIRFAPELEPLLRTDSILCNVGTRRYRVVEEGSPKQFFKQKSARHAYGFVGFCDNGNVFLFRRLTMAGGRSWTQAFRLNRTALEAWLLASVRKYFPNSQLVFGDKTLAPERDGKKFSDFPAALILGQSDIPVPDSAKNTLRQNALIPLALLLMGSAGTLIFVSLGSQIRARRRERFVSAVSHELRGTLNTLCGIAANLNDGLVPAKDFPKTFATLDKAGLALTHLFENVLAYSGLKGRRHPGSSKEIISVERLAEHLELRGAERLRVAGMHLTVQLDEKSRFVLLKTDVIAIERIVMNLLENTCKYACTPDANVNLNVRCTGKYLEISVRDSGPGIDAITRSKLFSENIRPHNGNKSLGLGLPLSRKIARALGGDLRLLASSSAGTCFQVRLPL